MKKTLSNYPNLPQQRQQLLQQLSGLQELRCASLIEQFLMVKRQDGSRVKCGPYPLKRGCVFTQIGLDREGYPLRDPNSTT
jgi:hypothetical protein